MKKNYSRLNESNLNVNVQYERNMIINRYRTKLIQIRAKIMQLIAKSKELQLQLFDELAELERDFQKSVNCNLKNSIIPTTTKLLKR